MKLTGNEVDVEEFTQATRSSMQVEHEVVSSEITLAG